MVGLVAALALILAQAVPPPVRVPGHVDALTAGRTTLFDGFDAYERLVDAFASAGGAAQLDPRVHARADRALDDWQRGERRAAVEAWTRLALELQGTESDVDLLAAALRLECVDEGRVTRIRRGCYSFGASAGTTRVRVRALFPLPELATRCIDVETAIATSVVTPDGRESFPAEALGQFSVAFDASGRFAPIVVDVQVGPFDVHLGVMDVCECDIGLQVTGRTLDRIRVVSFLAAAFFPFPSTPDLHTIEGMAPIALRGAYRAMWSRYALGVEAASLERSCEFLCGAAEPIRARARRPRWQAEEDSRRGEWEGVMQLAPEDEMLRDGRSPYADRAWTTETGPYWRTHAHGKRDVPAWTLIPEAGGDGALPVVVVLHEAGFDEGWALRLAGGGALFEEADRRGVAVLAPPNAALDSDPTAFAALIDSLAMDVLIDRARVHILAPSGAAPLAQRLAEAHPTLVASVIVLGEEDRARAESPAGVGRVLGLERPIAQALESVECTSGK